MSDSLKKLKSANLAKMAPKEMAGSLTVQSDGPGQGAAFALELPCPAPENSHE